MVKSNRKVVTKIRFYIFLRDVIWLSITAFGGPQAHLAMMIDRMVKKRGYLSEAELLELNALCQILPGPTSTQTIVAIGFKKGGPNLAYLTLLVWMLPAFVVMTTAGIIIGYLHQHNISTEFTKFIMPIAIGFVAFAAFRITKKVIYTWEGVVLMILAAITSYLIRSPYIYPVLLLIGGGLTAFKFKSQPIEEKDKFKIEWSNFILWGMVLVFAAVLGGITKSLPIRLFENFYRNGSLIFGGGQVLIPLLYTEFVEYKDYLNSQEFLSGFGLVQAVPGPTFSISAYIGALSMREYGIGGEILGAFFASLGIFLPGTFLIFFVIRFWTALKKYRIIKASLEGILAASSGMVISAAILLFQPIEHSFLNITIIVITFILLTFTKIPA
ncbi:MAG: chromate efflux transporter, partial [Cyclobacteriaceae bacterium]